MRRQGVSLLEVLFSVVILSVGVLGIGAMLTLGHRMERQIDRHDSVAACGRACLARVAMSDGTDAYPDFLRDAAGNYILDSNGNPIPCMKSQKNHQAFCRPAEPVTAAGWTSPDVGRFFYNGALFPPTVQPNDTAGFPGPVLVDPIGYARGAGVDFPPANAAEPRQLLTDTGSPLTVAIPRITPRTWGPGGTRQAMPGALAERLFSWSDDVVLPVPDDGSRPRQLYQKDAAGNPLVAQSEGAYTWSVMLQPADESLGKPARWQAKFRAWVLVYQRRDIGPANPPVERTVIANMVGGGVNGGDVKLTTTVSPDYLDVHKDSWLLLVGVDAARRVRCEFYRVAMVDREPEQETTTRWAVNATLRGPDWSMDWNDKKQDGSAYDLDGDGAAHDVLTVIIDGLVGVHQADGKYISIDSY